MDLQTLEALPTLIKYSEDVHKDLAKFAEDPSAAVPASLPDVIKEISVTGLVCYPWNVLSIAIVQQIDLVISEFQAVATETLTKEILEERKANLYNGINVFKEAPFTVQRMCEIIVTKGIGFATLHKLLNALEKLTRVNSIQLPLSPRSFGAQLGQCVNVIADRKKQDIIDLQQQEEIRAQKKQLEEIDAMDVD